jgi:hydroxymethylbilane synthase
MKDRITADLTPPILYHAVSQGALAVEIRSNDAQARELCKALTHWETQWKCHAERACLRALEGGCSVPVGVESKLEVAEGVRGGVLTLTGCVTAVDGTTHVEHTMNAPVQTVEEAEAVGTQLAQVLIETGAAAILDDIKKDRVKRAQEEKSV